MAFELTTFQPTMRLRFVERTTYSATHPWGGLRHVLQQWWMPTEHYGGGKWRDVPLEAESQQESAAPHKGEALCPACATPTVCQRDGRCIRRR